MALSQEQIRQLLAQLLQSGMGGQPGAMPGMGQPRTDFLPMPQPNPLAEIQALGADMDAGADTGSDAFAAGRDRLRKAQESGGIGRALAQMGEGIAAGRQMAEGTMSSVGGDTGATPMVMPPMTVQAPPGGQLSTYSQNAAAPGSEGMPPVMGLLQGLLQPQGKLSGAIGGYYGAKAAQEQRAKDAADRAMMAEAGKARGANIESAAAALGAGRYGEAAGGMLKSGYPKEAGSLAEKALTEGGLSERAGAKTAADEKLLTDAGAIVSKIPAGGKLPGLSVEETNLLKTAELSGNPELFKLMLRTFSKKQPLVFGMPAGSFE